MPELPRPLPSAGEELHVRGARVTALLRRLRLRLGRAGGADLASGPAFPGDADYWVKFKNIRVSGGDLDPAFDPDVGSHTLLIKDDNIGQLAITPELDIKNYSLLHSPKLRLNNEVIDYSPLDTVELKIKLNETIDAYDEAVTVSLEDPSAGPIGCGKMYTAETL